MTKFTLLICAHCSLAVSAFFVPPGLPVAVAQVQPPVSATASQASDSAPQPIDIKKTVSDLNARLTALQQVEKEQRAAQLGVETEQLQQRIAELTATVSAYEQLLGASRVKQSLQQEQQMLADRRTTLLEGGLPQKPPYTLTFYDSILDDLAAADQREESAQLAIRLSKQTSENLDARQAAAEAKWRLLNEKFDSTRDSATNLALVWEVDAARLQLELIRALLLQEKSNLENHQLEEQIALQNIDINNQKLNWIRGQLAFDEADLTRQLESVENRKSAVGLQLQKATAARKDIEESWLRTVRRYRDGKVSEVGLQTIETRRKTQQTIAEQLFDTQRLLGRQQEFWRYRYALLQAGTDPKQRDRWQSEVADSLTEVQRAITLQQNYQTAIQSQIAAIEKERSDGGSEAGVQQALGEQLKSLQAQVNQRQAYVTTLIATEQLGKKLQAEIATRRGRLTIGQRLSEYREDFKDIWNYEVLEIDNRPVTVRKVIISLLILFIGLVLAKFFIRYLIQRLLKFTRFRKTTLSAIRKVVSFTAYLLVFLFALRMVNIPLAAFAFLGGAVAIGLGFGAQNLINNFISGFIIMGERPINIGDLIEVDSVLGQVEEVGARCTRVRTGENIHILVPNSSLLEKNITNWTLSDQKIRTSVAVGVAYGSLVKEVAKLLLQATAQEARVIKEPKPFVLFNDFGDNALVFSVYFWIQIKRIIERREIESRLRFHIDALFGDAGIVIAFPQRDVHLDTHGPIELHMLAKDNTGNQPST